MSIYKQSYKLGKYCSNYGQGMYNVVLTSPGPATRDLKAAAVQLMRAGGLEALQIPVPCFFRLAVPVSQVQQPIDITQPARRRCAIDADLPGMV